MNTAQQTQSLFFRGPIFGSPGQRGACNATLVGSDRYASVALSTKYIGSHQGGWEADPGACGKCLCVSVLGGDDVANAGLQRWVVAKYKGLSFVGRVIDRLGEGADESIDILLDRPFAYAPPGNGNDGADIVNKLAGLRGFTQIDGPEAPETVGTWTAMWQFASCDMTHAACAALVGSYGYATRQPAWTPGTRVGTPQGRP